MTLTIFSMPKPFRGHFNLIQRNAIQSWMNLSPACEIILLGDDEGTAEAADEFGLRHIANVARNEFGTPLLNSVFEQAQSAANHPLLCYINADIILFNDFIEAISRIKFDRFLMIGQRWDLDVNEFIDFESSDWEIKLRQAATNRGFLHPTTGIDYFLFSKDIWGEIPPFALGRIVWDNWLVYKAREVGAAVIDSTQVVFAIHQNHDYSHVLNGDVDIIKGPEASQNIKLAGDGIFTLLDVNYLLTSTKLIWARSPEHIRNRMRHSLIFYPRLRYLLCRVYNLLIKKGGVRS
jgi:hypothetical protein